MRYSSHTYSPTQLHSLKFSACLAFLSIANFCIAQTPINILVVPLELEQVDLNRHISKVLHYSGVLSADAKREIIEQSIAQLVSALPFETHHLIPADDELLLLLDSSAFFLEWKYFYRDTQNGRTKILHEDYVPQGADHNAHFGWRLSPEAKRALQQRVNDSKASYVLFINKITSETKVPFSNKTEISIHLELRDQNLDKVFGDKASWKSHLSKLMDYGAFMYQLKKLMDAAFEMVRLACTDEFVWHTAKEMDEDEPAFSAFPVEYFNLSTDSATILTTLDGVRICVPKAAFIDQYGAPVSGIVMLKFRNFNDPLLFFKTGVSMRGPMRDEDSTTLNSYFMFELDASQKSVPVFIRKGAQLEVITPTLAAIPRSTNWYKYDTNTNDWDSLSMITGRDGKSDWPSKAQDPSFETIPGEGQTVYRRDRAVTSDNPDENRYKFLQERRRGTIAIRIKQRGELEKEFRVFSHDLRWLLSLSDAAKLPPQTSFCILVPNDEEPGTFHLTYREDGLLKSVIVTPLKLIIGLRRTDNKNRVYLEYENYLAVLGETAKSIKSQHGFLVARDRQVVYRARCRALNGNIFEIGDFGLYNAAQVK